jgi:cyclase
MHARYIPVLLLKDGGLYKTRKFEKETYLGDPINAIKIFNDKLVDELVFLDIAAARRKGNPNIHMLKEIAGECFMPLAYGRRSDFDRTSARGLGHRI